MPRIVLATDADGNALVVSVPSAPVRERVESESESEGGEVPVEPEGAQAFVTPAELPPASGPDEPREEADPIGEIYPLPPWPTRVSSALLHYGAPIDELTAAQGHPCPFSPSDALRFGPSELFRFLASLGHDESTAAAAVVRYGARVLDGSPLPPAPSYHLPDWPREVDPPTPLASSENAAGRSRADRAPRIRLGDAFQAALPEFQSPEASAAPTVSARQPPVSARSSLRGRPASSSLDPLEFAGHVEEEENRKAGQKPQPGARQDRQRKLKRTADGLHRLAHRRRHPTIPLTTADEGGNAQGVARRIRRRGGGLHASRHPQGGDGVGYAVKNEMGKLLDEWLMDEANLSMWISPGTGFPMWRKRVLITEMAAKAWESVCSRFNFEAAATRVGMRMTVDGSGDQFIRPQGIENYSFTDDDGGDAGAESEAEGADVEHDNDDVDCEQWEEGVDELPDDVGEEDEDDMSASGGDDDESDGEGEQDDTAEDGTVATYIGIGEAPEGYAVETECKPLDTAEDRQEVIGAIILMGWDNDTAEGWFIGHIHSTGPFTQNDLKRCPNANFVVRYAAKETDKCLNGKVAHYLSMDTYGVDKWWVFLRKI
ncbi:hypothetical protein AB1Y20_014447 [Prymnesium parvum]|uniref:Uncharacterized protein n=1 Tax=Prymnesium parvum TaxID=97485 RepID=A0AB34IHL9_PRYPA